MQSVGRVPNRARCPALLAILATLAASRLHAACGEVADFLVQPANEPNRYELSWTAAPSTTYEVVARRSESICDSTFTELVLATVTSGHVTIDFPVGFVYDVGVRLAGCTGQFPASHALIASTESRPDEPEFVAASGSLAAASVTARMPGTRGVLAVSLTRLGSVFAAAADIAERNEICPAGKAFQLDDFGIGGSSSNPQLPTGLFAYSLGVLDVLSERFASSRRFNKLVIVNVQGIEAPDVVMTRAAQGSAAVVGATAHDSFVLFNRGARLARVTLFPQPRPNQIRIDSAREFDLAPGEAREVKLSATSTTAGFFRQDIYVSDDLYSKFFVPVRFLAVAGPPSGSVDVSPVEARTDAVTQFQEGDFSFAFAEATFENRGTADAEGILVPEAPWFETANERLVIPAGQTRTFGAYLSPFNRPDAKGALGSIDTKFRFVYLGIAAAGRSGNADGPTLSSPVIAIATTAPPTAPGTVPPLLTGEDEILIPGVGSITGSVGQFITNLSIQNLDRFGSLADLRLIFSGGGTVTVATPTVGGGQSIQLADLVSSTYKQPETLGTLHIRSKSLDLVRVAADVQNKTRPSGTYGTGLPLFRPARAAAAGEHVFINGLMKSAVGHSNLYVQEASGTATSATLTFYDEDGGVRGQPLNVPLQPFGLRILSPAEVPDGSVVVDVLSSGSGKVVAFATPVDRASGDTWFTTDWSRLEGLSEGEPLVVPVAGVGPGRNGTYFVTDLALSNFGSAPCKLTLIYRSNEATISREIEIAPRHTRIETDVLTRLFNVTGSTLGFIEIVRHDQERLIASARAYTLAPGGQTYGSGVPLLAVRHGLGAGEERVYGAIKDASAATVTSARGGTFRTNLGMVELSGKAANVRVELLFFDGRQLAAGGSSSAKEYQLPPHGVVRLNSLASEIIGSTFRESTFGDLDNIQIRVKVIGGEGRVLPYITTVDNGSGDTILRIE